MIRDLPLPKHIRDMINTELHNIDDHLCVVRKCVWRLKHDKYEDHPPTKHQIMNLQNYVLRQVVRTDSYSPVAGFELLINYWHFDRDDDDMPDSDTMKKHRDALVRWLVIYDTVMELIDDGLNIPRKRRLQQCSYLRSNRLNVFRAYKEPLNELILTMCQIEGGYNDSDNWTPDYTEGLYRDELHEYLSKWRRGESWRHIAPLCVESHSLDVIVDFARMMYDS